MPLLRLLVPSRPGRASAAPWWRSFPRRAWRLGSGWGRPTWPPPADAPGITPAAAPAPTPGELAALIWAAVAAVLLLRAALGYRRYLRELRMGSRPAGDGAQTLFRQVCAALGLRRIPTLLVNPALASPVQAGVLRPMVVLSGDARSGEELRAVLLHELTHCRRLDALYKWLLEAAVCLHWFNPWCACSGGRSDGTASYPATRRCSPDWTALHAGHTAAPFWPRPGPPESAAPVRLPSL